MNLATLIAPRLFINLFSAMSSEAFHPDLRMFAFSTAGICLLGNCAFADDWGATQKQLLGKKSTELGVSEDRIQKVMRDGDEALTEEVIQLPGGPMLARGKMVPIFDQNMVVVGVTGSYLPVLKPKWRNCEECRLDLEDSLEIAYSMLTPIQRESYAERSEAARAARAKRDPRPS